MASNCYEFIYYEFTFVIVVLEVVEVMFKNML